MIELSAVLTGATTLAEAIKTAIDKRDDKIAKAAVADLQLKLYNAISLALAAQEERMKLADLTSSPA
ncbi:MAG: hypothetical protein LBH31_00625 [Burkholderiaceae bacterium]|jgi:hypothetical protein|nr:hypothetical protein [Burkholderiaceae bacterium]